MTVLELFNVIFLPGIFYGLLGLPLSVANVSGATMAMLILVQGGTYWHLKRTQITAVTTHLPGVAVYAWLKHLNWWLLALSAVPIGAALPEGLNSQVLPALFFWLLAVAEQINYFHVQLMYDNSNDARWFARHGFKKAHLSRDIARWRSQSSTNGEPDKNAFFR